MLPRSGKRNVVLPYYLYYLHSWLQEGSDYVGQEIPYTNVFSGTFSLNLQRTNSFLYMASIPHFSDMSRISGQQTRSDFCSSYVPEDLAQFCIEYTCVQMCAYIQGSAAEIQTRRHWNLICRSTISPPPEVVAQQYSSTTFVSLRFHSRKEKFGVFKRRYFTALIFFLRKCVILKFRKVESVCIKLFLHKKCVLYLERRKRKYSTKLVLLNRLHPTTST